MIQRRSEGLLSLRLALAEKPRALNCIAAAPMDIVVVPGCGRLIRIALAISQSDLKEGRTRICRFLERRRSHGRAHTAGRA
jgi:hypothetical protein